MKPFEQQTYYELLEVLPSATSDEIRGAYERLVKQYAHGSPGPEGPAGTGAAEGLRARLLEAMEILTDGDLRLEYDKSLGLTNQVAVEAPIEQLALNEVLSAADAVHSTHPRYAVSYIPHAPPEEPEASPAPKPTRTPETAIVQPLDPAGVLAAPSSEEGSKPPAPRRQSAPELATESALGIAEAALAQVTAKVREARPASPEQIKPKAVEVPHDAEVNGELLRRVRESRGLSLSQLAERTRIAVRHLENVEADRYDQLPATVYLRGILMNLARELRLDPLRVSKSYLGLVANQRK